MASIETRKDKKGNITGYRIRVCVGRDEEYKQVWRTRFISVDDEEIYKLTPAKLEKKLETIKNQWAEEQQEEYKRTHAKTDKSKATLADFIEIVWMPKCIQNGKHRQSTITYYQFMANDIIEYFGRKKRVAAVDTEAVLEYIKYLGTTARTKRGEPLSTSTQKHHYTALCSILEAARRLGYIKTNNPCDDLLATDKPQEQKKEVDYLRAEDRDRFFAALNQEPLFWRTFIATLLICGLRRGEALGLQWGDIQGTAPKNMTIRIERSVTMDSTAPNKLNIGPPKTENGKRTIPLSEPLYNLLMELKADQERRLKITPSAGAFIFSRQSDPSRPVFPSEPTRFMSKFTKKNGLPSLSPHDLRHSCATLMKENKVAEKDMTTIMGHGDFKVTNEHYIGTSTSEQRAAVDMVSDVVFAAG